jgi:hypothetical protein
MKGVRNWYPWFAWYPIKVDGRTRWLERREGYYGPWDEIRRREE